MGYYAIAPAGDTSGSGSGSGSTKIDYMNDVVFGLLFLFIALWALVRLKLYFDFSRRFVPIAYNYSLFAYINMNKLILTHYICIHIHNISEEAVTSMFYAAIAITAMIRSIWFLIPSSVLEGGGYTPIAITAYESYNWKGVLVSEVMLSVGSIGMYSSILLIGKYNRLSHYLQICMHIVVRFSLNSITISYRIVSYHDISQLLESYTKSFGLSSFKAAVSQHYRRHSVESTTWSATGDYADMVNMYDCYVCVSKYYYYIICK